MNRGDGGFSAPILVLLMALMVLFLGGISVDLWRVLSEHREVAGLADGAAAAGATALDTGTIYEGATDRLDPVLAVERVCGYLEHSGIVDACPGESVEVVVGTDSVFVRHTSEVPLTLLRAISMFGGDASPILVSSEAEVTLQRGAP